MYYQNWDIDKVPHMGSGRMEVSCGENKNGLQLIMIFMKKVLTNEVLGIILVCV